MSWMVVQADARRIPLADGSVHCVVTSPPYWGLRDYFFDKASVIRHDISMEERAYVEQELKKRGIKPRM